MLNNDVFAVLVCFLCIRGAREKTIRVFVSQEIKKDSEENHDTFQRLKGRSVTFNRRKIDGLLIRDLRSYDIADHTIFIPFCKQSKISLHLMVNNPVTIFKRQRLFTHHTKKYTQT